MVPSGRYVALVGLVLLCMALFFWWDPGVSTIPKTLPLSQTHPRAIYELGEIVSGTKGSIVIQLVVENVSDLSRTYDVKADCGCISVSNKVQLAPKERKAIPIEISVPDIPGPFRRMVRMLSLDESQNEMSLAISGTVLTNSRLRTNVKRVDFGRFKEQSVKTVILRRYNGMPVKYIHLKGPSYISVTSVDSTEVEQRFKTTLTLSVDAKRLRPGNFQENVRIVTDDEYHPMVGIEIVGTKLAR